MGQTVVFTVSLDGDDVTIGRLDPWPPRHPFRDAARTALADRRWRLAALACLVIPAVAAAVTFAITRGPWTATATLVAAALATPAAAAWAGARRLTGVRDGRLVAWVVTGASGAVLALASVPAVALTSRVERWGESGAIPTLTVLALAGAAGAWLGLGVGNRERAWPPLAAAGAVVVLALIPLGVAAALLPETVVTDAIVTHNFVATVALGRPAYICGDETVEVTRRHTEDVAWIALASPVAWVVDAPSFTVQELADAADGSVAKAQAWTRSTRVGPDNFAGHCYQATSLGTPNAVRTERYEKVGPIGAKLAVASALLCGMLALVAATRRRSA